MNQNSRFVKNIQQLDGLDKIGAHFLPCTITQGGQCPTDQYFIPQNDKVIIHGRELTGFTVQPPKPLYIIQQNQDGQKEIISEIKEFKKWTFYGNIQRTQQLVQFSELLDVVHKPIK